MMSETASLKWALGAVMSAFTAVLAWLGIDFHRRLNTIETRVTMLEIRSVSVEHFDEAICELYRRLEKNAEVVTSRVDRVYHHCAAIHAHLGSPELPSIDEETRKIWD